MLGKRRKRNESNLFGGGLLLLSSLSLVSIGFSTWTITDSASADLDITADDVETINVIEILSQSCDFEISQDGLVIDHTICDKGTISFSFSINKAAATNFAADGSLKILLTLTANSNSSFLSLVSSVSSDFGTISDSSLSSDGSIYKLLTLNLNSTNTSKITVAYIVKESNNGTNITSFYNSLPSFSFTASLETTK